MTDPKREAVARIIDPEKWAVLDSYLADMLRKYKGQNFGYDPEQFKDRASLAKADAILALGSADGDALIAEAARLIAPGEGEAVFYIRVGGEYSQMNVKAAKGVEPAKLLQDAIHVLKAEFDDLSNCPVHTPLPTPAVEALREASQKMIDASLLRAIHGRDHVPSMREEQNARGELAAALAALTPADAGSGGEG